MNIGQHERAYAKAVISGSSGAVSRAMQCIRHGSGSLVAQNQNVFVVCTNDDDTTTMLSTILSQYHI